MNWLIFVFGFVLGVYATAIALTVIHDSRFTASGRHRG